MRRVAATAATRTRTNKAAATPNGKRPNGTIATQAAAPTGGWHDVPAGAEVVFWALYRLLGGLRGLVVAQSVAAAVAFAALAIGLRRQDRDGAAVAIAVVVLIGAIPAVVVVGVQLF